MKQGISEGSFISATLLLPILLLSGLQQTWAEEKLEAQSADLTEMSTRNS